MGDDDGTLRYLHSYDEIMKGKGGAAAAAAAAAAVVVVVMMMMMMVMVMTTGVCSLAVTVCVPVHSRTVRDICFSPTDAKFCTCSDDSGLKVFDFDKVRRRQL